MSGAVLEIGGMRGKMFVEAGRMRKDVYWDWEGESVSVYGAGAERVVLV